MLNKLNTNIIFKARSMLISSVFKPNFLQNQNTNYNEFKEGDMYKPKNISIKKLTQQQQPQNSKVQQTRKNSRKSLNNIQRDGFQSKASPINIMKHNTYQDQDSSTDQANFIACINGYLNTLDSGKGKDCDIQSIKRKIKKEKQINRNLQKNIIQFQRILWERTRKLDSLEQSVRLLENKQNRNSVANTANKLSSKSSAKLISKKFGFSANSQYEQAQSDHSDSEITHFQQERYQKRRKTELPAQIQKMISQTMGIRSKKMRN